MIDERNTLNIRGGQDVFGSDGDKVGSVAGVEGDYVIVSKGFFFPTDYYIPSSAISSADEDGVYLNVTKDAALNQGWDTMPTTDTAYTDQELTDRATTDTWGSGQATTAQGTVDTTAAEYDEAQPFDHHADASQTHLDDSDTIRVPLSEEELTAQKREVDRGAVHVDKFVTEEQQTLDVPVTEERVNVSRRTVDRDVSADDTTFEEGTIEVPVRGEEVEVDKRARVREELEISKERVQGTQQVSDTVRREEADVREGVDTFENGEGRTTSKNR